MVQFKTLAVSAVAIAACGFASPGVVAQANGPVVINEFNYDDSGTDNHEFVELYNATGAAIDIGDWRIDGIDVTPPASNSAVIPTGTILAAGDYYVIGQAGVANLDLDVTANSDWQNDTEALTLYDNNGRIVDTVMYEVSTDGTVFDPLLAEGDDGLWPGFISVTRADVLFMSMSRCEDGLDRGINGLDFRGGAATPGATNNISDSNYADNYDSTAVGAPLADWLGCFVDPFAIDPTAAANGNPNAIPASPQGGNAAIFWDPSGGGNTHYLIKGCSANITFEAWVYIESAILGDPLDAADERESWSIGFGTEGYRYGDPDPANLYGFTSNGNSGVSWTYQRREVDGAAVLYFMDHNDGGVGGGAVSGPTVIGSIPIVAGTNDGWQRIRISMNTGSVEGRFGGTFGSTGDGAAFSAILNQGSLGLWVGYREFVSDNATTRPPTLDGVSLDKPPVECYLLIGTAPVDFPLPWSPEDCLRVVPFVTLPVDLSSIPALAIPNDREMLGFPLYSQVYMNNSIVFPQDPYKMSNGLAARIGYTEGVRYGAPTGMQLWLAEPAVPGGRYRIGFSIDGL